MQMCATGSAAAAPVGGGKSFALAALAEEPDITLRALAADLADRWLHDDFNVAPKTRQKQYQALHRNVPEPPLQ